MPNRILHPVFSPECQIHLLFPLFLLDRSQYLWSVPEHPLRLSLHLLLCPQKDLRSFQTADLHETSSFHLLPSEFRVHPEFHKHETCCCPYRILRCTHHPPAHSVCRKLRRMKSHQETPSHFSYVLRRSAEFPEFLPVRKSGYLHCQMLRLLQTGSSRNLRHPLPYRCLHDLLQQPSAVLKSLLYNLLLLRFRLHFHMRFLPVHPLRFR